MTAVLTGVIVSISSCGADLFIGDSDPWFEQFVSKIVLTVLFMSVLIALFGAFAKWFGREED